MHNSSKPCSSKEVGWLSSSKIFFLCSALGFRKRELGCFGPAAGDSGGFGSSRWSIGEALGLQLGVLERLGLPTWGPWEALRSPSRGLATACGFKLGCRSQPSRKTWFCKLRWGKTCILYQKTTVVYRLGPPSWGLWSALGLQDGALERLGTSKLGSWSALGLLGLQDGALEKLWASKLGSLSALDLQVEVLGRLRGLQVGVLERFGPPS